jgi:hypothetical protein
MNGGMDAVICGVSENEKQHFLLTQIILGKLASL